MHSWNADEKMNTLAKQGRSIRLFSRGQDKTEQIKIQIQIQIQGKISNNTLAKQGRFLWLFSRGQDKTK